MCMYIAFIVFAWLDYTHILRLCVCVQLRPSVEATSPAERVVAERWVCRPQLSAVNAAISACEKCSRWQEALLLFEDC